MNSLNYVPARNGKLKAVCQCCGKLSPPLAPSRRGEPDVWNQYTGWSIAPYPADFKHADGSRGSKFTCPGCDKKLRRGETLVLRSGGAVRQVA